MNNSSRPEWPCWQPGLRWGARAPEGHWSWGRFSCGWASPQWHCARTWTRQLQSQGPQICPTQWTTLILVLSDNQVKHWVLAGVTIKQLRVFWQEQTPALHRLLQSLQHSRLHVFFLTCLRKVNWRFYTRENTNCSPFEIWFLVSHPNSSQPWTSGKASVSVAILPTNAWYIKSKHVFVVLDPADFHSLKDDDLLKFAPGKLSKLP